MYSLKYDMFFHNKKLIIYGYYLKYLIIEKNLHYNELNKYLIYVDKALNN